MIRYHIAQVIGVGSGGVVVVAALVALVMVGAIGGGVVVVIGAGSSELQVISLHLVWLSFAVAGKATPTQVDDDDDEHNSGEDGTAHSSNIDLMRVDGLQLEIVSTCIGTSDCT